MKNDPLKMTSIMILKRGKYLYHFYYWIYGLYHDFSFAGKSLNKTVYNESSSAYPAQSLSYIYLKELVKKMNYKENDVFVDVGCAWGRLIAYLKKKTKINRFIGVELNEKIANQAQTSFVNDSSVSIICGNILDNLPKEGTLFYLFNPFDMKTMRCFLDLIERNINHNVRLLYLYPTCREEIDKRENWVLIDQVQLKPRHMGALDLCIYEFNIKR